MTFDPTNARDDLRRARVSMTAIAAAAGVAPWRVQRGLGGGWTYLDLDEQRRIAAAASMLLARSREAV